MRVQIVAKRYARALFSLGQEQGLEELRKYRDQLRDLAEVVNGSPELLQVFKTPVIRAEQKKAILQNILEKIGTEPMVRNFCLFLADQDRLPFFLDIERYFSHLLDEHEGILRGSLVTATELAKKRKDSIREELEKRFRQNLVLDYEVDDNILGGLVLKVGDRIYDASLRAQLQSLKENIKRGEL